MSGQSNKWVPLATGSVHQLEVRTRLKLIVAGGDGRRLPDELVIVESSSGEEDHRLDDWGELELEVEDQLVIVELPGLFDLRLIRSSFERDPELPDIELSVWQGEPFEDSAEDWEEPDWSDEGQVWDDMEQYTGFGDVETSVFELRANQTHVFEFVGVLAVTLSAKFFRESDSVEYHLLDDAGEELVSGVAHSRFLTIEPLGVDEYELKINGSSFWICADDGAGGAQFIEPKE